MRHVTHWSGEGKSKKLAELAASLFRSVGDNSYVIDPGEWAHGDKSALPDEWILISESGDSPALQAIAEHGVTTTKVCLVTGSTAAQNSGDWPNDVQFIIPAQLSMPDFLISSMPLPWMTRVTSHLWVELREYISAMNITEDDFLRGHPGGAIGKKRRGH